ARAAQCAGLEWDSNEAHSAIYDTEQTARLFCTIVNRWQELSPANPWDQPMQKSETPLQTDNRA
ncbi:ribonuclease T, partial [endosymbiont of Ridgeia piscesae]